MNLIIRTLISIKTIIFICIFINSYSFASGCDGYPFKDNLQVTSVDGGSKFISTATVAMQFDDLDEELQAKKEARGNAKGQIINFLEEDISTDEEFDKKVTSQVNVDGDDVSKAKDIVKTMVSSYKINASKVMRGLIQIGDCTNPGEFVKVTVGLKPETIAAAEETSNAISQSLNGGSSSSTSTSTSNSNEVSEGLPKSKASQNAQTAF